MTVLSKTAEASPLIVSLQCEVLCVSPSGYHEHFAREATSHQRKYLSSDALLVHTKAIHVQSRAEYGWPRGWKELLTRGIQVGKERRQADANARHQG